MDQRLIALYDAYAHDRIDRRTFLARLAGLTGSVAAGLALIRLIRADPAAAALVAPDDARLETTEIGFAGPGGELRGLLAKPKGAGDLPAVVVIHENRGLNPHIEDVARRAALEGFLALAPDFLSPLGGTPADQDQAREMIRSLDQATTLLNAVAAVAAVRRHPDGNGKVGAVGFCWGGGLVNQIAVANPALDAAVAFYGRTPEPEQVARIEAPLLLHYAGLDERINAGVPAFREALDKAGKNYRMHIYEGVNHAFHNDTAAARYDEAAATLAWQRTIAFFKETL